jgi:hypothetical protein
MNPVREALQEVDEILTEQGWHTDRGLLMRVRAALALPAPEPAPHWQFRVSLLDELSAGSGREREAATAIRQMADALHWWRDNAPLYAEPPAPREPTDRELLTLVRRHFRKEAGDMLHTAWKDGIDIQEPSYALRQFVADLLTAAAPSEIARDAARIDKLEACIRDGSSESIWRDIVAICQQAYKTFGPGPALRTAIDGALGADAWTEHHAQSAIDKASDV